jgi:hypothetical protein
MSAPPSRSAPSRLGPSRIRVSTPPDLRFQQPGLLEPLHALTTEQFIQHLHADDRDAVGASLRHAIANALPWQAEFRVVWPDGILHWMAARGHVQLAQGRARRVVGVLIDATASREAGPVRLRQPGPGPGAPAGAGPGRAGGRAQRAGPGLGDPRGAEPGAGPGCRRGTGTGYRRRRRARPTRGHRRPLTPAARPG